MGSQDKNQEKVKETVTTARRRLPKLLVTVARTFLFTWLIATLATLMFQERLVWIPGPPSNRTPAEVGLPGRAVELTARDGVRLHGWLIDAGPRSRGMVLHCHGNAGTIADRFWVAHEFTRLGLATLLFDYRGYGNSSGEPSEEGTYLDAEAAFDYLTQQAHIDPSRIIVWGESLGGAVAVELALRRPVAALVTESTFSSIPDVGARHYPWLPVRWIARIHYDSRAKAARVRAPWLLFHSRTDEIVPFELAEALHAAAASGRAGDPTAAPLSFVETRGGHNDGGAFSDATAWQALGGFLDGVLGPVAEVGH